MIVGTPEMPCFNRVQINVIVYESVIVYDSFIEVQISCSNIGTTRPTSSLL